MTELHTIKADSRQRRRRHAARSTTVVAAAAGAVLALMLASHTGARPQIVETASGAQPSIQATAPPSEGPQPPRPDEDDQVGVLTPDGQPAGFVSQAELDDMDPAYLDTGTQQVAAYEVHDADGTLTGYLISGAGFIDKATAEDGVQLDAVIAEHERVHQDRLDEMLEDPDPSARCMARAILDDTDPRECHTS